MTSDASVPAAIAILLAEHADGYGVIASLVQRVTDAMVGNPNSIAAAYDETRRALLYFEGPLERHIAREEGPLFSRLRAALPVTDRLIDEMVAEHDLIRMKRDEVSAAIEDVLNGHEDVRDDVRRLREQVNGEVQEAHGLSTLQHAVKAIAEKMRVHFQNEEELVFPIAPQLLDAATLDQVAREIAAIS